jgi:hypothetical protein
LELAEKDHRLFNAQSDRNTNGDVFQQIKAQFEITKDTDMMEEDEDEKSYWKEKIRIYLRDISQYPRLGLNASDDHPPRSYVGTTPQFLNFKESSSSPPTVSQYNNQRSGPSNEATSSVQQTTKPTSRPSTESTTSVQQTTKTTSEPSSVIELIRGNNQRTRNEAAKDIDLSIHPTSSSGEDETNEYDWSKKKLPKRRPPVTAA